MEEIKKETQTENKQPDLHQEEKKETHKEPKKFFNNKQSNKEKELEAKVTDLSDRILRLNAEMQNMRRHFDEEKSFLLKYEGEELIKDLLPTVDNFERAIAMDDANLTDELSKFLEGFKMIYGNLANVLNKYNIQEIEALNKDFDPNTMEAVMVEEVEGVEPNIVVDVLQKGYTYKGKVIRHAMVKVSK